MPASGPVVAGAFGVFEAVPGLGLVVGCSGRSWPPSPDVLSPGPVCLGCPRVPWARVRVRKAPAGRSGAFLGPGRGPGCPLGLTGAPAASWAASRGRPGGAVPRFRLGRRPGPGVFLSPEWGRRPEDVHCV